MRRNTRDKIRAALKQMLDTNQFEECEAAAGSEEEREEIRTEAAVLSEMDLDKMSICDILDEIQSATVYRQLLITIMVEECL